MRKASRSEPSVSPAARATAAKRRGVKFGRPRTEVDTTRLAELRRQGAWYAEIAKATGLSVGTVFRAVGC